jgi:hypothetical protein
MLKYSFIGSKQTVKKKVQGFLDLAKLDELIVVTPYSYPGRQGKAGREDLQSYLHGSEPEAT